ncbi:MAG: hypothetical protein JWN89_206 [Parcubacteria group bacterium]|nr:hypothetical protein [Parcubacteria group bacterium]
MESGAISAAERQAAIDAHFSRRAEFIVKGLMPRFHSHLSALPHRSPFYHVKHFWVCTGVWKARLEVTTRTASLRLIHLFMSDLPMRRAFEGASVIPLGFGKEFELPFRHRIDIPIQPGVKAEWAVHSTPDGEIPAECVPVLKSLLLPELKKHPNLVF